ncbi:DUF4145 domain-containing protein [Nissabacter sp. SGAir0207]|uniref:DUF4145 domain-containing protein n=1 Tax=Nissabacter sp. SGAir0207 TaxID=2126321 RepID=UPI0010CD05C9|nr:DUF4145 domain-containing protein [Nissabacter sp. SGAir0207]QCR38018.1 hypothetical protein C1N62_17915 [Nissabacter sp. SGAir0207]
MPAFLVSDCQRCNAKNITFTIFGGTPFKDEIDPDLRPTAEIVGMCKACYKSSIFEVSRREQFYSPAAVEWRTADYNVSSACKVIGVITPADLAITPSPKHLPSHIEAAFNEGSKCLSIHCYNAAATMFRLCLDFATKGLLPDGDEPSAKVRRSLGLRMEWLFDKNIVPSALRDLAECVKNDGNDGAHEGILDQASALDLEDFTRIFLERIYTEPARTKEAMNRRAARHGKE